MSDPLAQNKRIRKHFMSTSGAPRCGRQLSRPATTTANQQSMMLTSDPNEVKCRHCLRAMKLLAPVTRAPVNFDDVPSALELSEEDELEEESL